MCMVTSPRPLCVLAALCCVAGLAAAAVGQTTGATIILDRTSPWRMHHELRPPVVGAPGALTPAAMPQPWMNLATAPPEGDWTRGDYDDGDWFGGPADRSCRTSSLARLRLRGRFTVTDLKAAGALRLTLAYHGGAIVHLNGRPIAHGHVADAVQGIAEAYPPEAFVTDAGEPLAWGAYDMERGRPSEPPSAEAKERMKLHRRQIADLTLPRELLREGPNVLAIELLRAPYDPVLPAGRGSFPYELVWDTCTLLDVALTAEGGAGVLAARRPEGLQAWNADPWRGDHDGDYGNPSEPLRPVRIAGARNGAFNGKIVVGSLRALGGLRVTATDLRGEGGRIAADAVQIRYALPWGGEQALDNTYQRKQIPAPTTGRLLSALADRPPDPVEPPRGGGAVVPVWITVHVPADAAAGRYAGELAIEAAGEPPLRAALELTVEDWTLPDPQDYRTWVELMQSPQTLEVEYGVERWSQAHWDLIGRSLSLLRGVGSRVVYVPLICRTNLGNEESMVRWIDPGGPAPAFDFSLMDRYLDLAQRECGTPKIVVFYVWDVFLVPREGGDQSGGTGGHRRMVNYIGEHDGVLGLRPAVTTIDPAAGTLGEAEIPAYTDPAGEAAWRALFGELRRRMRRRGLEDAMMLGMVTDARPSRQEVAFFHDVSGGLPWVSHGHGGFTPDQKLHGIAPVGYQACVWHTKFADGVHTHGQTWSEPMAGWNQDQLTVAFERNTALDSYPLTRWRQFAATNITGGQRGIGRLGADFWPVIKDNRGRRQGRIYQRYPQSLWMNLNITSAVLAPGPDGPVATTRLEALREGVQECEARIAIERALLDDAARRRLGEDLVARCRNALDEQVLVMWKSLSNLQMCGPGWSNALGWRWSPGVAGHTWYVGSGWRDRSRELFALAGEVSRQLASQR
ncbi:MAG: DUF4091 domain-containing protein [Planctomycetes bacterium]|nr:DUF4091 domain-containing protein [Planctomycetota bacterium]